MFKNKKSKIDPNMTDTLIGEGSLFEGKLKSDAGIRVEGQIIGDIDSAGDVTIGENGVARSHIIARNVILAGQVVGNISAKGKLTIKASGKLNGNLSAAELSIESGGIFQGSSKMDIKEMVAHPEEKTVTREPEPSIPIASEDEAVAVLKTW
ncbi:bactofilin family protein [Cohnella silvisoli]|uniref:Polymer-forming cytoskeletal protein n=1 Tax=Cohnella silvisoli TaxID=2873699 RepID=A0ABV1L1Q9_9BACL|nr:polymer-forming cytoskeletal protein [Cohnella silvisoli]MCD9024881.1 polymer-forming cytoskeletal protein [Cohnella silvisoli]